MTRVTHGDVNRTGKNRFFGEHEECKKSVEKVSDPVKRSSNKVVNKIVVTNGHMFMRNVSHVHKLHQKTVAQEEDDYGMDVSVPKDCDPLQAVDQDVQRPVHVRCAPAHLNDYQL